jgi:hypothetical protein
MKADRTKADSSMGKRAAHEFCNVANTGVLEAFAAWQV